MFGCNLETLIVSDQHASIGNAVNEVYPGTTHGLCYYHLLNKLKSWGAPVAAMFTQAAYAYSEAKY